MLASVVIPTHNRSQWLRVTLRTVLWQTHVDLEAIVVDDGSTDETLEVVSEIKDERVHIVRHDMAVGVAASRNDGAQEANGEWLAFLDDDDLWAPDKLRLQIAAAEQTDRSWVYAGSVNVDEQLRVTSGVCPPPPHVVSATIARRNTVPGGGSNVALRRALFERAGPFDTRHRNTEDWDMWIRLGELGPPAWVPEPLVGKRIHPANASLDISAILAGVRLIEQRRGIEIDRGVLHRWIAESCLRTGRRAEALKHMARAATHGEAGPVLQDVLAILSRRLAPRRNESPLDPWIARAQQWVAQVDAR
jgi:glycosyltransferase involved in cell wall biosynthesis